MRGESIRDIEMKLGIPRSTLSGWLRSIQLEPAHKLRLEKRWNYALINARKGAVKWHTQAKEGRIAYAHQQAEQTLSKIVDTEQTHLEIALAFLYLGEGTKTKLELSLGNSNPLILRFFVAAVHQLYGVTPSQATCYLHLRADQDSDSEKQYWSEVLNIPIEQFRKSLIDIRTAGRATYSTYHGVCVVLYGKVALQRKLMYIANKFCEQVAK